MIIKENKKYDPNSAYNIELNASCPRTNGNC